MGERHFDTACAWIGGMLHGSSSPKISDFYIFPALIGAIILAFIASFIMKSLRIVS